MHDLRRLRAFHAVAERRSFSEAALHLGYAQSVVSHHVAALERELGVTLIDRGRRPVGVTPTGERLLEHVVGVLGHVAAAEDEMQAIRGLRSGRLRIGAFLTACTSFVPAALGRFSAAHPEVEVGVEQREPPAAIRSLRAGDIDLAVVWRLVGQDALDVDGVVTEHLGDDPYRIVLPPGHRLARRRRLRMADLAGERFNGPARDTSMPYRSFLDEICGAAGFAPDVAYEVQDVSVGRAFVAAGLSVALMPDLAVSHPRPDVVVRPVASAAPVRSVEAAWMAGRRVPAAAPMVRLLAEAAAARLGTCG